MRLPIASPSAAKAWCAAFGTPNVVHRTTTCEAARHVADTHGLIRADLDHLVAYPQTGQRQRRVNPRDEHQMHLLSRDMVKQEGNKIEDGLILNEVEIVQDQHELAVAPGDLVDHDIHQRLK